MENDFKESIQSTETIHLDEQGEKISNNKTEINKNKIENEDNKNKNNFENEYKQKLSPIDEPEEWNKALTIEDIENYIDYQVREKNNKNLDKISIIPTAFTLYPYAVKDVFWEQLKQFKNDVLPTEMIDPEMINPFFQQPSEEQKNYETKDGISRKVYMLYTTFEYDRSKEHIGCVVLFYDKNAKDNKLSAIFSFKTDLGCCLYDKTEEDIKNINFSAINIQADYKSCGVVDLEMAKHLTIDWYKEHKNELINANKNIAKVISDEIKCGTIKKSIINKANEKCLCLPDNILPKKLLAYKQGDLHLLEQQYKTIFDKNLNRGDIQNIKSEKNKDGKIQNVRLQQRKDTIKNISNIKKIDKKISEVKFDTNDIIEYIELLAKQFSKKNKVVKPTNNEQQNDNPAYLEYLEHKQIAKERDKARKLQGLDELKEDKIQTDFV